MHGESHEPCPIRSVTGRAAGSECPENRHPLAVFEHQRCRKTVIVPCCQQKRRRRFPVTNQSSGFGSRQQQGAAQLILLRVHLHYSTLRIPMENTELSPVGQSSRKDNTFAINQQVLDNKGNAIEVAVHAALLQQSIEKGLPVA